MKTEPITYDPDADRLIGEMEELHAEYMELLKSGAAVAADSDTPESDALWVHCVRNSGPMSGIRMLLKMQELERSRDLARRGIDCAINGIAMQAEITGCRKERERNAKRTIERLKGYLIPRHNS